MKKTNHCDGIFIFLGLMLLSTPSSGWRTAEIRLANESFRMRSYYEWAKQGRKEEVAKEGWNKLSVGKFAYWGVLTAWSAVQCLLSISGGQRGD
jgi:hypothetical protein